MIERRFHRELYQGESLDEAMKALAAYASFDRTQEASHWIVRVTSASAERERRVAGELGNRALALTLRRRA